MITGLTAAMLCAAGGAAHADATGSASGTASASSIEQEKKALDATGQAGVPADWDPVAAQAQAPVKQPSAAAAAAVAEAYCDPASVHEALQDLGIALSQDDAANLLGTNSDGTPWHNGSGPNVVSWPTSHVLNAEQSGWNYVPTSLPNSPTSAQKTAFEQGLVTDMNAGWPMIGNAYEVSGGPHLVAHPPTTFATLLGDRGYVW